MPTIGEVYNPLIEAAITDNPLALELLAEVGSLIFKNNAGKCQSVEDGIAAAMALA